MTSQELFKIHKELCDAALELMQRKNHDYAGKQGSEPFANFTRVEALGITTTEKGMMVRLSDKMSRLSSFMESNEFKVQDEKLRDTILDMINYAILLYAYLDEKNNIPYSIINIHKPSNYYDLEDDAYDLYSKGGLVPNTPDTI